MKSVKHLYLLFLKCLGMSLRSLKCYLQFGSDGQIDYSFHNTLFPIQYIKTYKINILLLIFYP